MEAHDRSLSDAGEINSGAPSASKLFPQSKNTQDDMLKTFRKITVIYIYIPTPGTHKQTKTDTISRRINHNNTAFDLSLLIKVAGKKPGTAPTRAPRRPRTKSYTTAARREGLAQTYGGVTAPSGTYFLRLLHMASIPNQKQTQI
jgi:hypothetical protein